jgi:predicted signal transduction protein with EAL and GGDEF domain
VLVQMAHLLRENTRGSDVLARYGGEEFVVLLPQVARDEALEVAEKLRRAVEEHPFEVGRVQPGGKVTISVGVATLPLDGSEQARLVDAADSALYASKRGGRNKVTGYQPGMEHHPGRERGPYAQRRRTGEQALQQGNHRVAAGGVDGNRCQRVTGLVEHADMDAVLIFKAGDFHGSDS